MHLGEIVNRLSSLVCAALLLASCQQVGAATVLYYDLAGIPNAAIPTWSATSVAPGLTGFDLSRGAGVTASNLTNGFSANGWHGKTSLQDAVSLGAYFQFGLGVNNGFNASLSSLDLSLRRSAVAAPMNMQVQASLDGFATEGIVISSFNYFGRTSGSAPNPDPLLDDPFYYMTNDLPGRPNTTTSPGDAIPTIDLTSFAALQNLQGGSQVTFRLFAWGNDSTVSTNSLALGRMVGPAIGGTLTAVPEPGSFAVLGATVLVGGAVRRFRRSNSSASGK
jgi:hypothetical protein